MITINYKPIGSDETMITLSAAEYYDNEDGTNIAKYEDPDKYLDLDAEQLDWLIITEPYQDDEIVFRYQYLDGINAFMVHSIWPDGTEEIIHSIDYNNEHTLVTRTSKSSNNRWRTIACNSCSEDGLTSLYKNENSKS